MYNVLEKLRAAELWSAVAERSGDTALAGAERRGGASASTPPAPPAHPKAASLPPHSIALTAKERAIHEHGLVTVLRQLHDQLDAAVAEAYALPPAAPDDAILTHLCALNARRAAEERTGTIRWLRPAFQNPTSSATQTTLATGAADATPAAIKPAAKLAWPRTLAEQAQTVRAALTTFGFPADAATLAKTFTSAQADRIEDLLETLASLGQARTLPDGRYVAA